MKVFLSYKFTGSDKDSLRFMIEHISKDIQALNHETFCFYRDVQMWGNIETDRLNIIPLALSYVDKCDVLLLMVTSSEISLGMGIEAGYAKAKGKTVLLAKKYGIVTDYLESISVKTITFSEGFPTKETLRVLLSS